MVNSIMNSLVEYFSEILSVAAIIISLSTYFKFVKQTKIMKKDLDNNIKQTNIMQKDLGNNIEQTNIMQKQLEKDSEERFTDSPHNAYTAKLDGITIALQEINNSIKENFSGKNK